MFKENQLYSCSCVTRGAIEGILYKLGKDLESLSDMFLCFLQQLKQKHIYILFQISDVHRIFSLYLVSSRCERQQRYE